MKESNSMYPVRVPRESANDEFVVILSINFKSGDKVKSEDVLFEVEGQKVAYDIVSPSSGFFYCDPSISVDDEIDLDKIIAVISDEEEYSEKNCNDYLLNEKELEILSNDEIPNLSEVKPLSYSSFETKSGSIKLAVIGGGAGFSQVQEISNEYENIEIVGIYDDLLFNNKAYSYDIPIIGDTNSENIIEDYNNGIFNSLIISISTNINFRNEIFNKLHFENGINFINLIHPSVLVDKTSKIGMGNIILPNCHIGPFAKIGNNNFISAFCNIEHHCTLGSSCTFGPGVMFSGHVNIENSVKFGTGIYVEPKVKISSDQFIKSGSILTKDT
jgi:acetyltransferase-like isoleucine patch superfamily enzyme